MNVWASVQRILAAVALILLVTAMFCVAVLTFAGCGDSGYEANKRVNFDVCKAQCADAGTSLGTFEQGLGYVKCSCIKKDGQ